MKLARLLTLLAAAFAVTALPAQETVPVVAGASTSGVKGPVPGAIAPEFSVLNAKGETVRLA
ncbi:MAG: hypothetical protein NTZ29_09930, partial [Verrucomicrobia bacterium]|nr:hypothetical protein [Verrucomicrobiota bacterium]